MCVRGTPRPCASQAGGVFFSPLFAFASSVTFLMTWIHAYHSLVDHPFYLDRQNASTSQASTEGNQGRDQSDVELGGLRIDYWQTWPLLVTVAVINFHREVSAARQFRLACVMQRLASRRIEQLRGEKQRLNYERAIEEHRAVRVGSDCGSSYGTEIELFQTWKRYGTETELLQMHRPVQLPQSPQSAQSAQSEQSEQSPFLPLTPQSLARVEALTRTLRKCGLELDREGEEAPLPLPQAQEPPAFAAAQAEAMMADGALQIAVHRVNEYLLGTHELAPAEVPRRNNVSATHRILSQQHRPALDGLALTACNPNRDGGANDGAASPWPPHGSLPRDLAGRPSHGLPRGLAERARLMALPWGSTIGAQGSWARTGRPPTLRDALSGLEARSLPSDASDDAVAARADELIAGIF
jgi:hypothetical protein